MARCNARRARAIRACKSKVGASFAANQRALISSCVFIARAERLLEYNDFGAVPDHQLEGLSPEDRDQTVLTALRERKIDVRFVLLSMRC